MLREYVFEVMRLYVDKERHRPDSWEFCYHKCTQPFFEEHIIALVRICAGELEADG